MTSPSSVVLITGASSGIGAATASLLAASGFRVVGASRRVPASAEAGISWMEMDVRDEESVSVGVRRVIDEQGRLDALVCNAGFGIFGTIEEVSMRRARAQFDTNVFGTLAPIRAVLPSMRERRCGRIVVVGSLAGRAPIPYQGHYSMTKAAVDALVGALRMEVATFGVHVSLVEPGDIKTPFNDVTDWGNTGTSAYGEQLRRCEQVIRESLEKAPGPEVIARAIVRVLTARRPRVRYTAGPSAWAVPFGRRFLPDRVALRLIRSHFKV
jgi:NAD(P)-dependent dehydrogenase (short-subunit alcohol dehydrogenase family)